MFNTNEKMIHFDTYPPMMKDYRKSIENEEYDNTVRWFVIPYSWSEKWIKENCDTTVSEFSYEYDWDETFKMYSDAVTDKVVFATWIEYR